MASAISVSANGLSFLTLMHFGLNPLAAGALSVWVGVAISFLGAERFVFVTRRSRPIRRMLRRSSAGADESIAMDEGPASVPLHMTQGVNKDL